MSQWVSYFPSLTWLDALSDTPKYMWVAVTVFLFVKSATMVLDLLQRMMAMARLLVICLAVAAFAYMYQSWNVTALVDVAWGMLESIACTVDSLTSGLTPLDVLSRELGKAIAGTRRSEL